MINHCIERRMVAVLLFTIGSLAAVAPRAETKPGNLDPWCDVPSFLRLYKLCADKIKAECIRSKVLSSDKLSADWIITDSLCGKYAAIEKLRSNDIQTINLCAQNAQINNLCIDSITTSSICVTDNIEFCTKFRANVSNHAPATPYTLGSLILFDTVDDDPNNNISQGVYTTYTVPRKGYYLISLEIPFNNLQGPTITGAPTAAPTIFINGATALTVNQTLLTFSTNQIATISILTMLEAGDILTTALNLYVIDPTLGLIPYVGTVSLLGQPGTNALNFAVHYLSGFCTPCTQSPATTCPITVCAPTPVSCPPCSDHHCLTRSNEMMA